MTTDRIIEIIQAECDWVLRYPRIPEITADSPLDWMSPIDRICAQCALDEAFGIELPSEDFEVADCVADIARLVELRVGVAA